MLLNLFLLIFIVLSYSEYLKVYKFVNLLVVSFCSCLSLVTFTGIPSPLRT